VHSPQFAGVSCTNATNRGRFGDSLYQLDEEVAAIMAGIVSTSQEANTLTVFTSESVAMPHDCRCRQLAVQVLHFQTGSLVFCVPLQQRPFAAQSDSRW
jgi:hypothetical protein